MRLLKKTVPSSFDLVLFGDDHDGTVLQHRGGIDELKEYILSNGVPKFACHMGDALEGITVDDKRYSHDTTTEAIPLRQARNVIENYRPIRSYLLTMLLGNHELKLWKFGNLTEHICKELGVEYGTWTSKLALYDDYGLVFKAFLAHGVRGAFRSGAKDWDQRQANLKAALKMKLKEKAGDCLVQAVGHSHLLLVVEPAPKLYLTDDGTKIKQNYLTQGSPEEYIEPDRRWYVNTGSFLKLYGENVSGYGEVFGYDPTEMGYSVIEVRDRTIQQIRKVTV